MKKTQFTLLMAAFFLCLSFIGPAFGAITMYFVDDPIVSADGLINVEANLIDTNPLDDISASLEFSWDNRYWNTWSDIKDYPIGDYTQIYFQLNLMDGSGSHISYDTDGILIWPGTAEGVFYGLTSYSSAIVNWGGFEIQFLSSSSNDNFAAVSLPSALLLLGTGLFGIIGFRRRS